MPIDRIVIAGGGVAAWLAASMVARALAGSTTTVHVVDGGGDDASLGIATFAETMSPRSVEHSAKAGYDENALIRATSATFALGTALSGWHDGPPVFLPLGSVGAPMGPVAFHQLAARLRSEGVPVRLANYTLAALCAQTGRFARPRPDERGVLSTLDYGLNVDTGRYRDFLRADALAHGVTVTAARVAGAVRTPDGTIDALLTVDGDRVAGDLFIDALGPSTPLGDAFESWHDDAPPARAWAGLHASDEAPLPFAHLQARADGWQRLTPLQGATAELRLAAGDGVGQTLITGRRRSPWRYNCIAIGGAAAVIDPIAGLQLDLAQSAIVRLTGLLPNDRVCTAEAAEFNRQAAEELDGAHEVATMLHRGNGRIGDAWWDGARARAVPPRLAHRIALFESCGRLALHDGDVLDETGWVTLFDAMGLHARRYDALADGIDRAAIDAHFARIRDVMLAAVATLPPHAAYLGTIGR